MDKMNLVLPGVKGWIAACVFGSIVVAPVKPVGAQDMPIPFQNLLQDTLPSQIYTMNNATILQGRHGQHGQKAHNENKIQASGAATAYHVRPVVTQRVKTQYVAWARRIAPNDADKITDSVKKMDVSQVWNEAVRENGLHSGDVADALTGYWMLNWALANNKDAEKTETLAVRNQVRRSLVSAPAFKRLSDTQKQELAETLMLNHLYQLAAYSQAMRQNNAALKMKLSDAAELRFQREMNLDLRALTLTKSGFTRRS